MYPMLQGGARMIGQGGGPHPQALGPPGGAQFPAQGDGPQGPQQGIYGTVELNHCSLYVIITDMSTSTLNGETFININIY